MKEKKSNIGKYLLILVPFVMGVTGFTVLDGQPVVDSLLLRYYRGDSIAVYGMTFTGKKWYRHWDPAG